MKIQSALVLLGLIVFPMRHLCAEDEDLSVVQTAMDHHDLRSLFEYAQTGSKPIRLKAIEDLIVLNDPQAVPHLLELLDEADNDIVNAALWGIPNFGSYAATDDVINRLNELSQHHPSIDIRHSAEVVSEDLKDPDKLKLMQDSITSKDRDMRKDALTFFIKRKDLSILLQARTMLKNVDPFIKEIGLVLVHGLDDKDSTTQIEELLKDPSPDVKAGAAIVIGDWKEEDSITELRPLLVDPTAVVRQQTVLALGAHPTPLIVTVLSRLSVDRDATVRAAVAQVLGKFASPESVGGLLKLAMDDNTSVRDPAIAGLVKAKDSAVTARMKIYLKDKDSRRRRRAAVAYLSTPSLVGDAEWIAPALHDPDSDIRLSAVMGVLSMPGAKVKIRLIYMLLDPQKEIRIAIMDKVEDLLKLPGLNKKILKRNLMSLTNDPDSDIREAATKHWSRLLINGINPGEKECTPDTTG